MSHKEQQSKEYEPLLGIIVQTFPSSKIKVIEKYSGEVIVNGYASELRRLGLSMEHIGTKTYQKPASPVLEVYPQGTMIKLHGVYKPVAVKRKVDNRRGKIKGFTKGSRKRLQQKLAAIDKKNLPVFVTLTYPAVWPGNPKIWKLQLKKFLKRLAYNYPGACGIWKLEPQRRGAPHFHLFVWGVSYEKLRAYCDLAWYEVVGSNDIKHLKAGVRVEKLRSWKGARSYASKYFGKVIDELPGWEEVGRYWGVFHREDLPLSKVTFYEIDQRTAFQLLRYMRRYGRMKTRNYPSLTLLCNNPSRWVDAIRT